MIIKFQDEKAQAFYEYIQQMPQRSMTPHNQKQSLLEELYEDLFFLCETLKKFEGNVDNE